MRKKKLPLAFILIVAFCAAVVGYAGTVEDAQAECGASQPALEASPTQAALGEPFGLHGEGFYGEFICDDTGPPFLSSPAGGLPTDDIRVELLQGTRKWTLATVSSDGNLRFDARGLTVPADAVPGKAVLRATSPQASPPASPFPPQADTPFLVLGDLPDAGGTGDSPWGADE